MRTIYQQLVTLFSDALHKIGAPGVDPEVRPATDAKFGDFQSNVAMGLAKKLGKKPRDVATEIVDALLASGSGAAKTGTACRAPTIVAKYEIAGPGFINIHLADDFLEAGLQLMAGDPRCGIVVDPKPLQHAVDFSSPNLAKEMHVGHLRTTITGEVICRVIEFMGHPVARVNHVGDWGTQFGMLLQYIYDAEPQVIQNPQNFHVTDLEGFYKKAKARFDAEPNFAEAARAKVVLLQSGDKQALAVWRAFVKESLRHCHDIYRELGVTLNDQGESFYNDKLAIVVKDLKDRHVATTSDGATCVFLDGFVGREGEPQPFLIQKTDGGYNYATTDLAAFLYRTQNIKAKRLIYVTDIRQASHFAMLFATAKKAGWVTDDMILSHIGYGMVLGEDRKPFKTRDGGTVRLKSLIDEAKERAFNLVTANRGDAIAENKRHDIASKVGLAAIKYSDLSHNLASDYVFGWDKMLAMEGNTGPYMLYVYARICSIGRKGGVDLNAWQPSAIKISHASEKVLAMALCRFGDVVHDVFLSLKPNVLTDYLFSLSKAFNVFYDKNLGVSVLDAETPELKASRLTLCALTAKILKTGLDLLSIDVVDEM